MTEGEVNELAACVVRLHTETLKQAHLSRDTQMDLEKVGEIGRQTIAGAQRERYTSTYLTAAVVKSFLPHRPYRSA